VLCEKRRVRSFNEAATLQIGRGRLGNLYSHVSKSDTIHGLHATTEKLEFPYFKANDLSSFIFILRTYVLNILRKLHSSEFSSFRDNSTEEADAVVTVTPRTHYPNLFIITSETSVEISMENTGCIFNLWFQHGTCHGNFIA